MTRPQPVHIQHFVELGLDVEAILHPATRARPSEPGDEASMEDVGVTGVFYTKIIRGFEGRPIAREVRQVNLLEGCDLTSPDLSRFLSNLTEALRGDLVDALFEEASCHA